VKPSRNAVSLTTVLASMPDSLQDSALLALLKESDRLSGGSCFEEVTSKYIGQLDGKEKNSSEFFLKFLLARGYDESEARQIVRRDIAAIPNIWSIKKLLGRCAGSDAAARTALAQAVNTEWLRLWRARLRKENSASLLSATAKVAFEVFSKQDVSYLALKTALSALSLIKDDPSVNEEDFSTGVVSREALIREAAQISKGRLKEASAETVTEALTIAYQCRLYAEQAGDREQDLDEQMRRIIEEDGDGEEDEDLDEVAIDLERLEVARLPLVSNHGTNSIFGSVLGDVMIYDGDSAEAAYNFAMATIANVILVPRNDSRYSDPLAQAMDASIAAMILAHGKVRTIRSRRQGGNADRIWDPAEASIKVLELWRRIFPNPDLANIL
jgi:hypothetical protein